VQDLEFRLLRDFTCRFDPPWATWVVQLLDDSVLGTLVAVLLVLLVWLGGRGRALALRTLLALGIALGLANAVRELAWRAFPRVRPATWVGRERLLVVPPDRWTCASRPDHLVSRSYPPKSPSFPSSHAIASGSVAATLTFAAGAIRGGAWAVAALAWAFALAVGASRLWLAKHWPTDVLGGYAIAVLAAWLAWRLAGAVERSIARRRARAVDGGDVVPGS
jgi:membrane-associated phospholipid phosphatase